MSSSKVKKSAPVQRCIDQPIDSKQSPVSVSTNGIDVEIGEEIIDELITQCVWPNLQRKGGTFTAGELSAITGDHERTIYRRLDGESRFSREDAFKIFRESLLRGGSPLTEYILKGFIITPLPETTIETLDQQIAEVTEDEGELRKAAAKGDRDAAMEALEKTKRAVAREESMISNLPKR